jgi:hypothetical protein
MRIDIPKLRCDKCGFTTTDTMVMGGFQQLVHYDQGGGSTKWDLCKDCFRSFRDSMYETKEEQ